MDSRHSDLGGGSWRSSCCDGVSPASVVQFLGTDVFDAADRMSAMITVGPERQDPAVVDIENLVAAFFLAHKFDDVALVIVDIGG